MNMTEVKTQELSGAALDWAVAKSVGLPVFVHTVDEQMAELQPGDFTDFERERLWQIKKPRIRIAESQNYSNPCPTYSTDWSQCGPLIAKIKIGFGPALGGWVAHPHRPNAPTEWLTADEPLVAICRAIVADKLGMVVSVPSELIP